MSRAAFKKHLKERGMTLMECARVVGVNRLTLWRWINGTSKPGPLAKAALKEKLGFDWRD
jgi:transcriptional regulator with XRE-family HTH domain